MPIEVNNADRRRQIGEAGVRIVRKDGVAGLTVRAVAEELGGSTSLVTNYVRNRAELLDLTLESLARQWDTQVSGVAGSPKERLHQVAVWALDWTSDSSPLVAKILIRILGEKTIEVQRLATLHRELDRLHGRITEALLADDAPDPEIAADLLYLASRGAMITCVENPGDWPIDRLTRVASHLTRLLSTGRPSD